MRKKSSLAIIVIIILLLSQLITDKVFSQHVYSNNFQNSVVKVRGSLNLKIIEIDPILKIAKETVPFDKPFFLKIKRLTRATTKARTESIDTTSINKPNPNVEIKHSIREEGKKNTLIDSSSTVESINLIPEKEPQLLKNSNSGSQNINSKIYPSGNVYQEDGNSEYIYIRIDNLKPNSNYALEITWSNKGVDKVESIYFTTLSSTLDTRLKQRLSPQLGIAFPLFKFNDKIYPEVSLMLGVYYQFRAIDPDIPSGPYKPLDPRRFSLLLGLTINTVAIDYLREDLFGSNNIVVGLGYQPIDAVRVSYGGFLFQELNPNKIISHQKSFKGTSYIAVTLDLKLKEILTGIFTTLGFK